MARTVPLQDSWTTGMRRDHSRGSMPRGSAWNLVDWIPGLGAPLRKRGGYTYASANITSTKATADHVVAGIYAEFTAGAKNLAIDEDGELYTIVSSSSTTDVGAALAPLQNPVFHRQKAIITGNDGTTAPKYYDGTTLGALAGSPPAGRYACVYKDRTILSSSTANNTRLWFSGAGDPTSWDTTNAWWDSSHPVTGLAALRNAILIFSTGHTERLRGSTPPPGSDMIMDPLFEVGCTDARSIAIYGESCVFANPAGIYRTDGAALVDLTAKCGVKSYWQETLAAYTSSYTIAGGIYRGFYIFTVMNGSSFVDAGMINIESQTFMRLANIDADCFWHVSALSEELYFGRRGAARVGAVSPIFVPVAATKADANGTSVTPILETVFYTDSGSKKTFRKAFARYDIRDAASDNPTFTVAYLTSPEATSYTTLGTLAETTALAYGRLPMNFSALGVALKISQNNASSDSRLYDLSADVHSREMSRVA